MLTVLGAPAGSTEELNCSFELTAININLNLKTDYSILLLKNF